MIQINTKKVIEKSFTPLNINYSNFLGLKTGLNIKLDIQFSL